MDLYDTYVRLKLLSEKSGSDQQDAILALLEDMEKYLGGQNKSTDKTPENEPIETIYLEGHDIDQYMGFNCKYCHGQKTCDFYANMKRAKSEGFDRIHTNLPYECEDLEYGEITDISSQKEQEYK